MTTIVTNDQLQITAYSYDRGLDHFPQAMCTIPPSLLDVKYSTLLLSVLFSIVLFFISGRVLYSLIGGVPEYQYCAILKQYVLCP